MITLTHFFIPSDVVSQETRDRNNQFWLKADVHYSFANDFYGRSKASYQSIFDAAERWRGLNLTQEIRYLADPTVEIVCALRYFFIEQNDTINRNEIRPAIGVSIDILNRGRLRLEDYFRFEWRQFFYNFSELNKSNGRFRNRLKATFAINKEKPFLPKTFSLITSFEFYMIRDLQLRDRFANKHRFEGGLLYRFNDQWRSSISYYRQFSRNQIEGEFDTQENILEFTLIRIL